jgi:hypothetical protein
MAYIEDIPSVSSTADTMLSCATMCAFSELLGGATCLCFNYNSTSMFCGLYASQPNNFVIDKSRQTVAYQVIQKQNASYIIAQDIALDND